MFVKRGKGRPKLPKSKKKLGISVKLSPPVVKWLKGRGPNRSAEIENLCQQEMAREPGRDIKIVLNLGGYDESD